MRVSGRSVKAASVWAKAIAHRVESGDDHVSFCHDIDYEQTDENKHSPATQFAVDVPPVSLKTGFDQLNQDSLTYRYKKSV